MSEHVSQAKQARETLARALGALQSDPTVPPALMDVAEPVAMAMGALHAIERSGSLVTAGAARDHVRAALGMLQAQSALNHPAVTAAMESVAGSLGVLFGLVRAGEAAAAAAAQQPAQPAPAAPQPAAHAQPAYAPQPAQPAQAYAPQPAQAAPAFAPQPAQAAPAYAPQPAQPAYAPQPAPQPAYAPQPAAQPAPAFAPQQAPAYAPQPAQAAPAYAPQPAQPAPAYAPQHAQHAQHAPQPAQAAPAYAPQPAPPAPPPAAFAPAAAVSDPFAAPRPAAPAAPAAVPAPPPARPSSSTSTRFEVALGTSSATNFYKGLSGNDVIEHGGIFVATYSKVPSVGAPVALRVILPGGFEFEATGTVVWVRDSNSGESPGFGARFSQISQEARQLVYRYVRNREPLFYDDL